MKLNDACRKEQLKNIRALYESAFPKSEKKPFRMILKGRQKGSYEIFALEGEAGEFLGLAITMCCGELVLLDYFAIEPEHREKGVGSQALKALQQRYSGKKFLLEIESTVGLEEKGQNTRDDNSAIGADEAARRLRRKAFYMRNGMAPMDFLVNLFGVEMELMTYECSVTFEEYHTIFEQLLPLGMASKIKLVSAAAIEEKR